jgi:hypothetical protein
MCRFVGNLRKRSAVLLTKCLSRLGGKNVEVGLPHVAADEAQPFDHIRSQRLQALPQRHLGAPLSDPQQPPTACVDLVNDGQEVVGLHSVSPVNVIHTDRCDAVELAMLQTSLHEPLHRPIDRFRTGLKGLSRFPPAQPPCPASKKSHHGAGHRTLAVAPGYVLNRDTVLAHSTRRGA